MLAHMGSENSQDQVPLARESGASNTAGVNAGVAVDVSIDGLTASTGVMLGTPIGDFRPGQEHILEAVCLRYGAILDEALKLDASLYHLLSNTFPST